MFFLKENAFGFFHCLMVMKIKKAHSLQKLTDLDFYTASISLVAPSSPYLQDNDGCLLSYSVNLKPCFY